MNYLYSSMHYLAAMHLCFIKLRQNKETYFIFWLIIDKPHLNLHSGDTWLGTEGVPRM